MADMRRLVISGGTIVTPHQVLADHSLVLEAGKVAGILPGLASQRNDAQEIDATGLWVVPGLIDLHVHGSLGHDVMDATPEALRGMARFFASHGVTSYLATTLAASREATQAALANAARVPSPSDGAQHLGVHLEGPYLHPKHAGAQPLTHLREPDRHEFEDWLRIGGVRLITLAPELPGAIELIDQGVADGIEFAVGHSGASYEQVIEAADHGLRQSTHTFNGMLGIHHRTPGTVGAILTDDRIYAQVIPDGIHLHPAIFKLLVRVKGPGRTILITDAVCATGLADGKFDLGGQTISVRQGVCRTPAGGLAGSTLTLETGLRNAMQFAGLSLPQALPMVTSVPAEAMGLQGQKGSLVPGADADVVLLDPDLKVRLTIIGGKVVHVADERLVRP
jgi:N-acetylglucosamine-6-phosphate deacetylase